MTTDLDRTNKKNTGKTFEHELDLVFRTLEIRKIARIRKVDPPVRIVGGGFARRTIFLPNPFLDYAGVIFGSGRAIFLEAKSTSTHRLPINRSGGVTEEQVEALRGWTRAGAYVGILWRHAGRTVFVGIDDLEEAIAQNRKSLKFEELPPMAEIWEGLIPALPADRLPGAHLLSTSGP